MLYPRYHLPWPWPWRHLKTFQVKKPCSKSFHHFSIWRRCFEAFSRYLWTLTMKPQIRRTSATQPLFTRYSIQIRFPYLFTANDKTAIKTKSITLRFFKKVNISVSKETELLREKLCWKKVRCLSTYDNCLSNALSTCFVSAAFEQSDDLSKATLRNTFGWSRHLHYDNSIPTCFLLSFFFKQQTFSFLMLKNETKVIGFKYYTQICQK